MPYSAFKFCLTFVEGTNPADGGLSLGNALSVPDHGMVRRMVRSSMLVCNILWNWFVAQDYMLTFHLWQIQVKADIEEDDDGLGEWGRCLLSKGKMGWQTHGPAAWCITAEYFPCVAGSSQSEGTDFAIFGELPCTNLHTSFEYHLFWSMFNT